MRTVTLHKTLCGALALACIAAGVACQRGAVDTNSNATNATTPTTATTAKATATPGTTPALTEEAFTGSSTKIDFNEALAEALANAIAAAKAGLKTLTVEWRLEELSGVHGGFIPRRSVTVKIQARAVSP